jgi:hypothetical protein
MYRPRGLAAGQSAYTVDSAAGRIDALPIPLWSTKAVTADWTSRRNEDPLVESDFSSTGIGDLQGSLSHQFPGVLSEWLIAYGNRVYRPAADESRGPSAAQLEPGRLYPLQRSHMSRRELKGYLTGTRQLIVKSDKPGQERDIQLMTASYDPLARDAAYILRMVTFYAAAGGEHYTGLRNAALRELDLSPLLDLDRAVLFGRLERPALRCRIDGEVQTPDRQETFVRVVLPVRRTSGVEGRKGLLNLKPDTQN